MVVLRFRFKKSKRKYADRQVLATVTPTKKEFSGPIDKIYEVDLETPIISDSRGLVLVEATGQGGPEAKAKGRNYQGNRWRRRRGALAKSRRKQNGVGQFFRGGSFRTTQLENAMRKKTDGNEETAN